MKLNRFQIPCHGIPKVVEDAEGILPWNKDGVHLASQSGREGSEIESFRWTGEPGILRNVCREVEGENERQDRIRKNKQIYTHKSRKAHKQKVKKKKERHYLA